MSAGSASLDARTVVSRSAGDRIGSALSSVAVHPLLLAVYAVAYFYADNVADVEPDEVVLPLLVVTGVALGLQAALTLIIRDTRRAAILASTIIIPALFFGLIRETLGGPAPAGSYASAYGTAMALAATVLLVCLGLYFVARPRWTTPATQALNVASLALLLMTTVPLIGFARDASTAASPETDLPAVAMTMPERPRDIYHLVFDRYGSDLGLRAFHGIDNSAFTEWLRDRGFTVVRDGRANYVETALSLGSTLSMSPISDLAASVGSANPSYGPILSQLRENRAGSMLKALGYEYIHIGSYYGRTRRSDSADRNRFPEADTSFATALVSRSILTLLHEGLPSNHFVAEATEFQFDELAAIAAEPGPKYVFAHFMVPHPPFVYLEDGTYAQHQATFETQLAYANRRIQGMVEQLLAVPESERPIIIIQGDEGPYPARYDESRSFDWSTATDEELVTKFGILNAWYLPGPEGAEPLRTGLTAVNTYPELFRRYFDADVEDLPDRTYSSNQLRPYDLTDITDRLTLATERLGP